MSYLDGYLKPILQRCMFNIIVADVSLTISSHAPNTRGSRWNEIAVTGVDTGASLTCELKAMFMIGAHFGRLRRNIRGK